MYFETVASRLLYETLNIRSIFEIAESDGFDRNDLTKLLVRTITVSRMSRFFFLIN